MTTFRTTEEWLDPNTRKFEMFMNAPGGGPEVPMMSYIYTRA